MPDSRLRKAPEAPPGESEFRAVHPPLVTVVIPGRPAPQPRPRHTQAGGFVRTYTPDNGIIGYRQAVALMVRAAMAGQKHLGPVELFVRLELKRPESHWSVTKKRGRVLKETAPQWVVDGDCSNYLKGIEDALNKIAWGDDIQIVDEHVSKRYAEENRTIITIQKAEL